MPELLTMQDLANGHLDVKALGEAANGDENTIVTTRTGNTYPSAERAINIMFQNGGLPATPFPTLAKMQTDGASLADGQLAQVYNETANNGLYVKTAGVWVKSAYDPANLAKSYVDEILPITGGNLYDASNNANGLYITLQKPPVVGETAGAIIGIFPVTEGAQYTVQSNAVKLAAFRVAYRSTASTAAGTTAGAATLVATEDDIVKSFIVPRGKDIHFALVSLKLPSVNLDATTDIVIRDTAASEEVRTIRGATIVDMVARANMLDYSSLGYNDNRYNPNNNVTDRYVVIPHGNISSATGTMLTWLPVVEGATYHLKAAGIGNTAVGVAFRTTNSVIQGATLGLAELVSGDGVKSFTVPTGKDIHFAFINVMVTSTGLDMTSDLTIEAELPDEGASITSIGGRPLADAKVRTMLDSLIFSSKPSVLHNKKWVVIGDSITEKNFRAGTNYHEYVAADVGGMSLYNYGISGSGFWNRASTVTDSITQNPDYITVFWGANDLVRAPTLLGDRDSTGTDSLGGLINITLSALVTKFYNKKLALFTLLPRDNYNNITNLVSPKGYTATQVADLLIAICEKYNIPVLDLYRGSGLFPWIPEANDLYFKAVTESSGDGLHPNSAGQRELADKIRPFLESL